MKPLTISFSVGRIAVDHDTRKNISKNVDRNLIPDNKADFIFVDKLVGHGYSIEEYTNAKFQPYIDEYNVGKKPCRQIKETYTEHIAKENEKLLKKVEDNKNKGIKTSVRKPTKLAHEYVLQVGDRESNSTKQMPGETMAQYAERMRKNKEYCKQALKEIQEKYPHADILLATYHADEPNGTPHMHLLIQFTGDGYEKGLSHQISISRALEEDGFERGAKRGEYSINRWTKSIKDDVMDPLLKIFDQDQEREVLNEHREHLDTPIFREKAKREAEALEEKRKEARDELETIKNDKSTIEAEKETLISSIEEEAKQKINDIEAPTLKAPITEDEERVMDRLQFRLEEALQKPEQNKKGETVYRVNFTIPGEMLKKWISTLKKIKGLFNIIKTKHKEEVKEAVKTVKEEAKQKVSIKDMLARNKAVVAERERQKAEQGLVPAHKKDTQSIE